MPYTPNGIQKIKKELRVVKLELLMSTSFQVTEKAVVQLKKASSKLPERKRR